MQIFWVNMHTFGHRPSQRGGKLDKLRMFMSSTTQRAHLPERHRTSCQHCLFFLFYASDWKRVAATSRKQAICLAQELPHCGCRLCHSFGDTHRIQSDSQMTCDKDCYICQHQALCWVILSPNTSSLGISESAPIVWDVLAQ